MKEENIKHEFFAELAPPPGYSLDRAVGTTYSMDLKALLTIPLAFQMGAEADPAMAENPFVLLRALKRCARKIDMFCQKGGISPRFKNEPLYRLIENSVHEVLLDDPFSFHPKLWVARYVKKKEPVFYKVIVLSRNLTYDQSWDCICTTEGYSGDHSKINDDTNRPLARFVEWLYRTCGAELFPEFCKDLLSVNFRDSSENHMRLQEFLPLGIEDGLTKEHVFGKKKWEKIVMVSPFLSDTFLADIRKRGEELTVVSRREALEKTDQARVDSRADELVCALHLKERIVDAKAEDEENTGNLNDAVFDLHAKMYLLERGRSFDFLIGSANATYNAFHGNVEFMVRLKGEASHPCETFLKRFFDHPGGALEPYEPLKSAISNIEDQESYKLERAMRESIRSLEGISARCVADEGGLFRVEVDVPGATLKPSYSLLLWPAHFPESSAQAINGEFVTLVFRSIEKHDLSELFCLRLRGPHMQEKTCIFKIPLSEVPADREEAVIGALIASKSDFFRLLLCMLSPDQEGEGGDGDLGGGTGEGWLFEEAGLLETMYTALSRYPDKVLELRSVIVPLLGQDQLIRALDSSEIETFKRIWAEFLPLIDKLVPADELN